MLYAKVVFASRRNLFILVEKLLVAGTTCSRLFCAKVISIDTIERDLLRRDATTTLSALPDNMNLT